MVNRVQYDSHDRAKRQTDVEQTNHNISVLDMWDTDGDLLTSGKAWCERRCDTFDASNFDVATNSLNTEKKKVILYNEDQEDDEERDSDLFPTTLLGMS